MRAEPIVNELILVRLPLNTLQRRRHGTEYKQILLQYVMVEVHAFTKVLLKTAVELAKALSHIGTENDISVQNMMVFILLLKELIFNGFCEQETCRNGIVSPSFESYCCNIFYTMQMQAVRHGVAVNGSCV